MAGPTLVPRRIGLGIGVQLHRRGPRADVSMISVRTGWGTCSRGCCVSGESLSLVVWAGWHCKSWLTCLSRRASFHRRDLPQSVGIVTPARPHRCVRQDEDGAWSSSTVAHQQLRGFDGREGGIALENGCVTVDLPQLPRISCMNQHGFLHKQSSLGNIQAGLCAL